MSLQAAQAEYPVVHVTRIFKVSADRLFTSFTSAQELSRWFGPEGVTVSDASVDLRVGGVMSLTMNLPDGNQTQLKTVYKEIVPGKRLVFSWQWLSPSCEGSKEVDGETLVSVDFREVGDKQTEVSILHEGLPTPSARDSHASGWNGCLDSLQSALFR